jgi:hypothetical protein
MQVMKAILSKFLEYLEKLVPPPSTDVEHNGVLGEEYVYPLTPRPSTLCFERYQPTKKLDSLACSVEHFFLPLSRSHLAGFNAVVSNANSYHRYLDQAQGQQCRTLKRHNILKRSPLIGLSGMLQAEVLFFWVCINIHSFCL